MTKKKTPKTKIFSFYEEDVVPAVMSTLTLSFRPFSLLSDNFKAFLKTGSIYMVLLSLVSFAAGFSYICMFKVEGFYCAESGGGYLAYSLLRMFLLLMFSVKLYEHIYLKEKTTLLNIFKPGLKEVKLFLLSVVIMLLNVAPALSFYILYIRVPNPDWILETMFFALVSIGFVVPFAAMRFYSLFGFILGGETIPSLHMIWKQTKGSSLKIILGIFLLLILSAFVLFNFYVNFSQVDEESIFSAGIVSEVLYNLFVLILLTLFINHCLIQRLFLGENK